MYHIYIVLCVQCGHNIETILTDGFLNVFSFWDKLILNKLVCVQNIQFYTQHELFKNVLIIRKGTLASNLNSKQVFPSLSNNYFLQLCYFVNDLVQYYDVLNNHFHHYNHHHHQPTYYHLSFQYILQFHKFLFPNSILWKKIVLCHLTLPMSNTHFLTLNCTL